MTRQVQDAANSSGLGAAVLVVGAGATGLSAAWWLAQEGVDVLVIDKGIVGWEASGRNGGGCSHHFSPLFVEEQRLWPEMDRRLGYPTEFQSSRMRIAFDAHQFELYGQGPRNAARYGFTSELLDAQQVRAHAPLAGDNAVGAHYYTWGGHANPQRTVQAYAWAMQDHGGRVLQHTAVDSIVTAGGRVTGVRTESGVVACDHLVLAAGPQTRRLAATVGIDIPMVAARAEMIVTEPLPVMPMGGVDGNGLYGRQTLRGNLAYGGGPHEWTPVTSNAVPPRASTPLMRNISSRLAGLFPRAAHARVIRSWAGIVENTPDGRPLIERMADPGNLTVATLSSIGFGLSPATGRAIRDLVVDGVCGFADLSTLRLSRFAALEADWTRRQGWMAVDAE